MYFIEKILVALLFVFLTLSSHGGKKTYEQLQKEKRALELRLSALKGKKGTSDRRKRAKIQEAIKVLNERIKITQPTKKKKVIEPGPNNLALQPKNIALFGELQAIIAGKKHTELRNTNLETQEKRKRLSFSEKTIHKYNNPGTVVQFTHFTIETLAVLRDLYRSVPGIPEFVDNFLNGNPSQHRLGIYRYPSLYSFWGCTATSINCTVLMPNPSYTDHDLYHLMGKNHNHFKYLRFIPGGFALVTWNLSYEQYPVFQDFSRALLSGDTRRYRTAIHNHFGDISHFSIKISHPNFYSARHSVLRKGFDQERISISAKLGESSESSESSEGGTITPPSLNKARSGSRVIERSQSQKERHMTKSTKTYATILDLTKDDTDWLKELKSKLLKHLKKVYGVEPRKDQVMIYYHFPYGEATVTLHTHIRVNQAIHPLEASRSFMLDEIIQRLERSDDDKATGLNMGIVNMIIERTQSGFFSDRSIQNGATIREFMRYIVREEKTPPMREVQNFLKVEAAADGKIYQGTDEKINQRIKAAFDKLNGGGGSKSSGSKKGGGKK